MSDQHEVERVFGLVVDLSPEDRELWFAAHLSNDAELRREVESLIASDLTASPDFARGLQTPEAESPVSSMPVIAGWKILAPIGEGGMGRVYLAEDQGPLDRRAAIKVLKRGLDTDEVLARFESERRTLARMRHPGIATVFEAGATEDGRPYIAMEVVDGATITEYCSSSTVSIDTRLELFLATCEAIQHAHQKGIIHRDLKPSNIPLIVRGDSPRVKIIDFGIAKAIDSRDDESGHTRPGEILGTFEYMSPEQIEGDDVDIRTDVYALGLILYELITGKLPYDAPTPRNSLATWRSIIVDRPTPRPSAVVRAGATTDSALTPNFRLRQDLDWIVLKALAKEPARRYASVAALSDDVKRYQNREPILARPPTVGYRVTRFVDRHRGLAAATSAILVTLILGLIGTSWGFLAAREETAEARRSHEESARVVQFLDDLIGTAPTARDGRETTLREAVDASAERIDGDFGDRPRVAAVVHLAVGRAYVGLRRYGEARNHLERAVELNLPWVEGSLDRTIVHRDCCLALAALERQVRDLDTTLAWIDKGLAPESWDAAKDRHARRSLRIQLARVRLNQRRLEEAESILREILAEPAESEGMTLSSILLQSDLAFVLRRRGEHVEAERLFRKVVEQQTDLLTESHPLICNAYLNHASALRTLGRDDEAGERYHRAALLARDVWGDTSPELARALMGHGHLKRSAGRRTEARELYVESLQVMERVHGEGAPAASSLRNSLGSLLVDLGDLEEAGVVLEANQAAISAMGDALLSQRELTLRWLAELRLGQDRLDDAEALLSEAIDLGEVLAPASGDREYYTHAIVRFAEVARRRGDLDLARERLDNAAVGFGCADAIRDPLVESMPSMAWRFCAARVARDLGDLELAKRIATTAWERLTPESSLSLRIDALICRIDIATAVGPHNLDPEIKVLIDRVQREAGEDDPWIRQLGERLTQPRSR